MKLSKKKNPLIGKTKRIFISTDVEKIKMPSLNFPVERTCLLSSVFAEHPRLVCTQCYAKFGQLNQKRNRGYYIGNIDYFEENPEEFFQAFSTWLKHYPQKEIEEYQKHWLTIQLKISKKELKEHKFYFRFFSSGDLPTGNEKYFLSSINKIAEKNQNWVFWMPTLKKVIVESWLKNNELAQNLVIRFSSPVITYQLEEEFHNYIIKISKETFDKGIRRGHSYLNRIGEYENNLGKKQQAFACVGDCVYCAQISPNAIPACFNRNIEVIGYEIHKSDEKSPKTVAKALKKELEYMPGRTLIERYIPKDSPYRKYYRKSKSKY